MSKHMTIINLACTITKVRKWGEGWKHSAESAYAAFEELQRKHKEAERTIETLRANLTQTEAECQAELAVVKDERDRLRVERDALRAGCDDLENAIEALKKERDELATRLRQSIARGDFAEMRLATLAAELETERERHRQTAAVPQSVDVPRTHPVPCDPPEATHITPDGKATAQAAVTPQPGDVVRLVRVPSEDTVGDTLRKSLEWPWKSLWGSVGDRGEIVESVGTMPGARSVRIMNTGVKVWWPLSCVEIVKGGE